MRDTGEAVAASSSMLVCRPSPVSVSVDAAPARLVASIESCCIHTGW